jgi:hypothetical protein
MTTAPATRRPRASRPDLRFLFHIEDVTARHTSPLLTLRADIAQHVAVNHDGTVRTPADEHRGTPTGGKLSRPFGRHDSIPEHDLNGSGWQWMDTDELRFWLDHQLAGFCQVHGLDGGENR